jgi:mannosyltransferase
MYAWLVLVTCFAWLALFMLSSRRGDAPGEPISQAAITGPGSAKTAHAKQARLRSVAWIAAYGLSLVALAYSHPLGLVMGAVLALAGLIGARECFGGWRRCILVHGAALLLILPWLGNYFDHPPEFLSGRPSFRLLLGTPIGFIGGDFRVLVALLLLIALGLWRSIRGSSASSERRGPHHWSGPVFLVLWLSLPPTVLYVYSLLSYPIFGPARYTAFVAPAFLLLVAAGLRQLPAVLRFPGGLLLAVISALALGPLAYSPDLKADWRGFATAVSRVLRERPRDRALVIVASADPARNVEVETARYYLSENCTIIPAGGASPEWLDDAAAQQVYFAVGLHHGQPVATVPKQLGGYRFEKEERYSGLAVFRGERSPATSRTGFNSPSASAE